MTYELSHLKISQLISNPSGRNKYYILNVFKFMETVIPKNYGYGSRNKISIFQ